MLRERRSPEYQDGRARKAVMTLSTSHRMHTIFTIPDRKEGGLPTVTASPCPSQ